MNRKKIVVNGMVAVALMAAGSRLPAAEVKAGKALYEKRCASCHGADGKGNPAMVKAMGEKGLNVTTKEVAGKKDDELVKIILEGKGKMPPAKGLAKEETTQILEYTRSLAK